MDERYFAVPESLANEVLNYLADRPFREVANMVSRLQRVEAVDSGDPDGFEPSEESLPAE